MAIALQAEGVVERIVGMRRIIGDGRCIADWFRPSRRRWGCVSASSKIKVINRTLGESGGGSLFVRLEIYGPGGGGDKKNRMKMK